LNVPTKQTIKIINAQHRLAVQEEILVTQDVKEFESCKVPVGQLLQCALFFCPVIFRPQHKQAGTTVE